MILVAIRNTNERASKCHLTGAEVPPGEGFAVKFQGEERWRVVTGAALASAPKGEGYKFIAETRAQREERELEKWTREVERLRAEALARGAADAEKALAALPMKPANDGSPLPLVWNYRAAGADWSVELTETQLAEHFAQTAVALLAIVAVLRDADLLRASVVAQADLRRARVWVRKGSATKTVGAMPAGWEPRAAKGCVALRAPDAFVERSVAWV